MGLTADAREEKIWEVEDIGREAIQNETKKTDRKKQTNHSNSELWGSLQNPHRREEQGKAQEMKPKHSSSKLPQTTDEEEFLKAARGRQHMCAKEQRQEPQPVM